MTPRQERTHIIGQTGRHVCRAPYLPVTDATRHLTPASAARRPNLKRGASEATPGTRSCASTPVIPIPIIAEHLSLPPSRPPAHYLPRYTTAACLPYQKYRCPCPPAVRTGLPLTHDHFVSPNQPSRLTQTPPRCRSPSPHPREAERYRPRPHSQADSHSCTHHPHSTRLCSPPPKPTPPPVPLPTPPYWPYPTKPPHLLVRVDLHVVVRQGARHRLAQHYHELCVG